MLSDWSNGSVGKNACYPKVLQSESDPKNLWKKDGCCGTHLSSQHSCGKIGRDRRISCKFKDQRAWSTQSDRNSKRPCFKARWNKNLLLKVVLWSRHTCCDMHVPIFTLMYTCIIIQNCAKKVNLLLCVRRKSKGAHLRYTYYPHCGDGARMCIHMSTSTECANQICITLGYTSHTSGKHTRTQRWK